MGNNISTLLAKSVIVFQKDLRLEFRTRYALNAIGMFAITTLTAVSFSFGPIILEGTVHASLLWVILFFAAMSGLSHIFVREEEQQTSDTLRLVVPANAVWLGKWLFNIALLFALEIIIIPLYCVMMDTGLGNSVAFLALIVLGSVALASTATIVAAIISMAGSRGALFAVLVFPIALPVLVSAINGTRLAFENAPFSECYPDLQILFSFSVVMITTSLLVFEFVWRKS